MKDVQGDPAYGRTNWRRFAVAVGVPTVVAGGLVIAMANGALAASFSVSGEQFQLTADQLKGNGFTQYGGALKTGPTEKSPDGKTVPAAMSGMKSATITNLCQSVAVGPVVLRIEAGKQQGRPVEATGLVIGMSELSGSNVKFENNVVIGQDASTLNADGRTDDHGAPGSFGQQADQITIDNLRQKAYVTTASTFTLPDMKLSLGTKDCFTG